MRHHRSSRMGRVSWVCSAVLLLLLLVPGFSQAVTENRKQAEAHFLKGVAAFRANDLKTAATEMEEALKLDRQPILLFNLAMIHDKAGDNQNALRYYLEYLKTDPPDALFIKGKLKQYDPAALAAVEQELEAARAGKGEGEGEPAAPVVPVPTTEGEKEGGGFGSVKWTTWAVLGVGVAALAAGGTFGMLSSSAADDFDAARLRAEAVDAKDLAESRALFANIGFGVGAAALAGGAVLLVLDLLSSSEQPEKADAGDGGDLGVSWNLRPAVSPNLGGLSLQLSF